MHTDNTQKEEPQMTTTLRDEVGSALELGIELSLDCFTFNRFAQLVVARGLAHLGTNSWACEKDTLEGLFERTLASQRAPGSRSALLDLGDVADDAIAWLWIGHSTVHIRVAGHSVDDLGTARAWLRERYPPVQPSEEQQIWITFWSQSPHGARELTRKIDVPAWDEIAANYPRAVRERIAWLAGAEFKPGLGGRLLLWHGVPGTGKTYALRALGWEWRSWCDFHYVTDPETFFGSSPAYMLDVLLHENDDGEGGARWRLLILEDTGELLAADAKERTGQGLSRLLNVVDGLIGQGLRVLVLVTTNETLRSLHPAVSRPGRCASQIEFTVFNGGEAAEWLAARGIESACRGGTLGALYAHEAGAEEPDPRTIGFARERCRRLRGAGTTCLRSVNGKHAPFVRLKCGFDSCRRL
jgi:hypothetical protein